MNTHSFIITSDIEMVVLYIGQQKKFIVGMLQRAHNYGIS